MVLELHQSLCGQIEAPKLWHSKLRNGMEARKFRTSELDPCLFISDKMIAVCYVDDVLCWLRTTKILRKNIKSLEDKRDEFNWEMTVSKMLQLFLGSKSTKMNLMEATNSLNRA